jgi:hypothetical protein
MQQQHYKHYRVITSLITNAQTLVAKPFFLSISLFFVLDYVLGALFVISFSSTKIYPTLSKL